MADRELLFIAAHSRSGSTLLEQALAAQRNCVAVGEMRYVWTRGFLGNHACGCGRPFADCEFWQGVIEDAFGSLRRADVEHLASEEKCLKNPRILVRQLAFGATPFEVPQIRAWAEATKALVASVYKLSGAETVIDSSKTPTYGIALARAASTSKFRAVHLVRDPRAVAYSRMKSKRRPEVHWKEEYMAVTKATRSAVQWDYFNLACEALRAVGEVTELAYEDFVGSPMQTVREFWHDSGKDFDSSRWIDDRTVVFSDDHTVSGNPIRFQKGEVEIKEDVRWLEGMSKGDINKVNVLTFPLMWRYGYRIARDGRG